MADIDRGGDSVSPLDHAMRLIDPNILRRPAYISDPSASWFLSAPWMLNAGAAVDRLSGSARNSPLTAQRAQHVVTTSVAYRW